MSYKYLLTITSLILISFNRARSILIYVLFMSFPAIAEVNYSPYVETDFPMNVYWGDTHLHTRLSGDTGGQSLSLEDAYRFARGEVVTAYNGTKMRRQRPLDFLVIADHAENIGLLSAIQKNDAVLAKSEKGRRLLEAYEETLKADDKSKFYALLNERAAGGEPFVRSVWEDIIASADHYNALENFTAFIGYEWTSWGVPSGSGQLHRVVLFKDDAERTRTFLPYSGLDSSNPEDLWSHLQRYELETGGDAIAIPHNGNLSSGRMFILEDTAGTAFTQTYAKNRSRWEPLFEVTQIKGDSEAHPFFSPNDEFADYETFIPFKEAEPVNQRRQFEYARSGLKLGLDQYAKLGINPFKFGMIGSTDAHGGLSAVAENNFIGKAFFMEPSNERLIRNYADGGEYNGETYRKIPNWQLSAAGYAAVWAHKNSRAAIFEAMKRKEVYATTGPRMTVRFFGGWEYQSNDALRADLAKTGYEKGVPMGGDLTNAPTGKSPSFLIRAIKDPDGANLDRVQVIKGWRDSKGELQEEVYNVALSGNRLVNKDGSSYPVGSTVNIADASYTNSIGNAELAVVWKDPDFKKNDLAFYYVRVLEIPTPRWPAYDAKKYGLKDVADEVAKITQERAYTSPIWYTP